VQVAVSSPQSASSAAMSWRWRELDSASAAAPEQSEDSENDVWATSGLIDFGGCAGDMRHKKVTAIIGQEVVTLTWLADAGVLIHHLRIAGHGSLTTTQRYLHADRLS
jgi:hypothetical protein